MVSRLIYLFYWGSAHGVARGCLSNYGYPPSSFRMSQVKKRSRRFKVLLGTIIGVAIVLGGSTTAYAAHYSERALPGVSVGDLDLAGQTGDEARLSLSQRADEIRVGVEFNDQTTEYTLAEIGVSVDIDATVEDAFADNGNLGKQIAALFNQRQVPAVITVDEQVAEDLVGALADAAGGNAKDAAIALNEAGDGFVVNPGVDGIELDATPLIDAAQTAAKQLSSQTVTLVGEPQKPTVGTEQAQQMADRANELIALDVSVAGRVDTHAAAATDKAQWLVADPAAELSVDLEKVTAWVNQVADSTKVEAEGGVHNVNTKGEVVGTPQPGISGWAVNNAADVAAAIAAALNEAQPYAGEFNYDETEPSYETRTIDPASANLAYQAAPGEKWIDINLSTLTMTAFEGGSVVYGPTGIVPGMPGMETPTGTFAVYLKYESQTMRGTNLDGSRYVAPDVPWVTYFTGPIALHGAPWQSSFGWDGPGGSHGCVNLPVSAAEFVYHWAPLGTVVVSHY